MLNYGEALSNLPDEKILCRLFDWNCEWLSRPNIAISEMASTLKENWTNIMAYRGTVFTEEFVDDLRKFVDPIVDPSGELTIRINWTWIRQTPTIS